MLAEARRLLSQAAHRAGFDWGRVAHPGGGLPDPNARFTLWVGISVLVHLFLLFGITFRPADPRLFNSWQRTLDVVLVNSKTAQRPEQADALAQTNLDGGGNTDEKRVAKSPLPVVSRDTRTLRPQEQERRVAQLEREAQQLLTQVQSRQQVEAAEVRQEQSDPQTQPNRAQDLVQRSLEIARLEAQISRDWEAYQKRPRRKFLGARTQEYRFAQYVEDWRLKIERVGTLNYPEQARRDKIFGGLQLTVAIRADGTVEAIEINRSSGKKVLDDAAVRIVQLAAPFAPFPANMRTDTDVLHITRTWTFTRSDELVAD